MKAMLFAAGLGTRLKPFTDNAPKALARVHDRTLLEWNIRYLQKNGIYDVVVNVHHFADAIEEVLRDSAGFGSNVQVSDERGMLLETGGGLKKAAPLFAGESSFVVMNVDVLTNLDLVKMISAHRQAEVMATLAVMRRASSRYFLFNDGMQLCGWRNEKTGDERIARITPDPVPFAFSGIQVVSADIFNDCPFEGKFSLVDWYLYLAARHNISGYDHTGDLFIDVGKPESLAQAGQLFS